MKRHAALQDLSREHHHALKLALDCRRAAAAQDAAQQNAMIAACSARFASELEPHFQIEERDLLPRLAAAGETALVERTLGPVKRALRDAGLKAPEIDGVVHLLPPEKISKQFKVGDFVRARIVQAQGHDLVAQPL